MSVRGNLKDMSLPNITQNICLDQRTASLVLRQQIEEGVIFFDSGEIIHAEVGNLSGEEAIYKLLKWIDGTFCINEKETTSQRTVNTPWGHIMLEGMRLLDEQQLSKASHILTQKILSEEEIDQDSDLEYELIMLVSNLEQMQDSLNNKKVVRRPTMAIEILAGIVNELIGFSETYIDVGTTTDHLTKALAKATDLYPSANMLQVQNNRLYTNVVTNLYNSWSGNDTGGRQKTFSQIINGILDILETYFSLLISCFHSQETRDESREIYKVFLNDLTKTANNINF